MYLITDDSNEIIDNLSVEELSLALENKGYRTISQDDFISYSVYLDEEREKADKQKSDKPTVNEKEQDNEKETDKTTEKKEDKNDNKETDEKKDKDKAKEKEEKSTKKVTINVEQGFVSQDIAKLLKEQGIIKDEKKFAKYMEDNGYSSFIQIGKFTVNSDMDHKQLAETLTTYPGN